MKNKHCFAEPKRYIRQGFPEAVYAPGKTLKQILSMTKSLILGGGPVLITRTDEKTYKTIKKHFKNARYSRDARLVYIKPKRKMPSGSSYICVITAGTSDIPVAEESAITAETMGHKVKRVYDVGVSGMHRLLKNEKELLEASCVVVCAGMEGALASVVGGMVNCPVIAVPTSVGYGASFKGVSALLTMLNSCAANVSVVNIDDGFGAGVISGLINSK